MSSETIYNNLTQLGAKTSLPESPEKAVLERVPNPQKGISYLVRFTAPEFTSLCPITGQPDFAHIMIDYLPGDWLVESKSLKLYLGSFRNHGSFHEDCTISIARRLIEFIQPQWLRIRRLLVSSRWNAHRYFLPDRRAAARSLAPRTGSRQLSWPGIRRCYRRIFNFVVLPSASVYPSAAFHGKYLKEVV